MELNLNINYYQVLKLVRQLPYKYKKKLSNEITEDLKEKQAGHHVTKHKNESEESNELQHLLLDGPIMTDEQFKQFKQLRKDFDKWLNQ